MTNIQDTDIALWLHNKLGTSNDSWTASSICWQLNAKVLRNIKNCFHDLESQVKLQLLLSFFHISKPNIKEWRVELEEIIEIATLDGDQWVSMLSETMKTFPSTGLLNTDFSNLEKHRSIFGEIVDDLRKLSKKQNDAAILPLECLYLNKTALTSMVDQQPSSVKHFTLKKQSKSAALKAELLQKSIDAANNLKKSTARTVDIGIRSRGMPTKMSYVKFSKGISSRIPTCGDRAASDANSTVSNKTLISKKIQKENDINLSNINDQPFGYTQANKRIKMLEL